MFAVASPKKDHAHWLLFYGTDYHSHLATAYGGMMMIGDAFTPRVRSIKNSQFKTEFAKDIPYFDGAGNFGIGSVSSQQQPVIINPVNKKLGTFAIAFHGYIANADELAVWLINHRIGFDYDLDKDGKKIVNQAKLIGRYISTKADFVEGINYAFNQIKGSASVLIANCDGIYAARSKYGHTMLTLGRKQEHWVVTSETTAFPNLMVQPIRMLDPGEIIHLDGYEATTLKCGNNHCQFCPFFWVYTGWPTSEYYDLSAESYRNIMGQEHACKDIANGFHPYAVCGIADSGCGYDMGYNNGSIDCGHPVKIIRVLSKYTAGWPRSFIFEDQLDRDRVALHKQVPNREKWSQVQGKSIILTDDSIVRGTQFRQLLNRLEMIVTNIWAMQFAEIHIRVGSPILGWHCPYLGTTKTREEMAARKAIARIRKIGISHVTDEVLIPYLNDPKLYEELTKAIAWDIGAKTVRYPTLDEMISKTGLPQKDLCTYCWNGQGV